MVDNTTSPSYLDSDTQKTGKNQSRSVATHPRQGHQEEACLLHQEDMNFHSDELEFLNDGIEKAAPFLDRSQIAQDSRAMETLGSVSCIARFSWE